MVDVIIIVFIALFFFVAMARIISRSKQQMAHRDRCAFCRARLKKTSDRMRYASTCSKCGQLQPWATGA